MASEAAPIIPDEVSSLWESLDPAVRAALIKSEADKVCDISTAGDKKASDNASGKQGRRANAESGPRMDDTSSKFIGGDSFVKREANPKWLKVRSDVYDGIKAKRDEELAKKVPVDITVTMPDGKTIEANKV